MPLLSAHVALISDNIASVRLPFVVMPGGAPVSTSASASGSASVPLSDTESAPVSVPHRLLVWDDLTVWGVACVSFVAHMAVAWRYGFHRDELYYIAAGFHPAWGYVDHPALVPMLARFAVTLFGASVVGLRLFAALACAAVIVLAGYLARELGAGKFAAALTALAVAVAPIFVSGGHLFQTVAFDQLVWAIALALLARVSARGGVRRGRGSARSSRSQSRCLPCGGRPKMAGRRSNSRATTARHIGTTARPWYC